MFARLFSIVGMSLFYLVCAALIFGLVAYRSDVVSAQETSDEDETPVAMPRSAQAASEEDDDENDDDPPTDNDGIDTPLAEDAETAADPIYTYTIRPGDTLLRIARRLGVPYAVLRAQDDTPSVIHPGQKFTYRPSDRIDSSIPLTDDDGTDSDGYDTPPPTTDFDGISTPPPTSFDGTDSDGIATSQLTDNDGIDTDAVFAQPGQQQLQAQQQQHDPNTDNDGTDSDGIATSQLTDNDGTDSDGIATSQLTDNDGTDSDGIDTTGNLPDTPPSPNTPPDSPDSVDTDVST